MSALLLSFFLLAESQNTNVTNEIRELTVELNKAYERNELDEKSVRVSYNSREVP